MSKFDIRSILTETLGTPSHYFNFPGCLRRFSDFLVEPASYSLGRNCHRQRPTLPPATAHHGGGTAKVALQAAKDLQRQQRREGHGQPLPGPHVPERQRLLQRPQRQRMCLLDKRKRRQPGLTQAPCHHCEAGEDGRGWTGEPIQARPQPLRPILQHLEDKT